MLEINEQNARKLASAIMDEVAELLVLRAKADILREEMRKIDVKLLERHTYMGTLLARDENGKRIKIPARVLDPDRLFIMNHYDAEAYYKRRDKAIAYAGYDVPAGYCPAAMAEHAQQKAEWRLVDAAYPYIGVTRDDLLCSRNGLERYHQYVDLLCGLCASL